jgi:hypothetical protein
VFGGGVVMHSVGSSSQQLGAGKSISGMGIHGFQESGGLCGIPGIGKIKSFDFLR